MVDQVSHHTSTQRVEPTTTAGGGGSTRAYVQVQGMQASRARTYLVSAFGLAPPLQGLVLSPVRRRELRPARRARAASAHDGHVREEQRACAGHASSRRLLPPCRIACCVHHTQMRIRLATVATTTRSKGWHRAAERWPKTRTKTTRETTTHGRHDDRVRASRATQGQQASLLVAPCLTRTECNGFRQHFHCFSIKPVLGQIQRGELRHQHLDHAQHRWPIPGQLVLA
jgi:hypothetical protein